MVVLKKEFTWRLRVMLVAVQLMRIISRSSAMSNVRLAAVGAMIAPGGVVITETSMAETGVLARVMILVVVLAAVVGIVSLEDFGDVMSLADEASLDIDIVRPAILRFSQKLMVRYQRR